MRRGFGGSATSSVVAVLTPHDASSSARRVSAVWPVRARKTSSRLGWPSEKSATRDARRGPAPRRASARGRRRRTARTAPAGRRLEVHDVPSSRARTAAACGRCSGSSSRTCSAPLPTDALSWPGVPSAITWPRSMTAIPSASWSASSRYCVQSRIVVPWPTQRADDVPHLVARARVEAGGRLVEEQQLGRDDDAGGDVQPAAHAAGVVLDQPAGRVLEAERLEQLVGAGLGAPPREAEQPAEQDQVLAAGQVLVDRGELAGQADRRRGPRRPR